MTAKKVGIITQYYRSHNYGGLLQAYALTVVLSDLGYNVEQIAYDSSKDDFQGVFGYNISNSQIISCAAKLKILVRELLNASVRRGLNKRFSEMEKFGKGILHSDVIYDKVSIDRLPQTYHQFVVGSDQVWNPQFYAPVYFCEFAKGKQVNCISYAASVSQKNLTEKQAKIYKEHMKNFSAISLRESNIEIIQSLTDKKVEWVLDPTLLLTDKQWDKICTKKLINVPYVFCYFLGDDRIERRLAEKFAKKKKCKLITIPHLSGMFDKADFRFGDKKLISASPGDFVSLIKHADYVFTDSFHACAFAHIYKKRFFVFQRIGMQGMSTRIETLVSLFGTEKYFCDSSDCQTIEYLIRTCEDEYEINDFEYVMRKKKSIDFLKSKLV